MTWLLLSHKGSEAALCEPEANWSFLMGKGNAFAKSQTVTLAQVIDETVCRKSAGCLDDISHGNRCFHVITANWKRGKRVVFLFTGASVPICMILLGEENG